MRFNVLSDDFAAPLVLLLDCQIIRGKLFSNLAYFSPGIQSPTRSLVTRDGYRIGVIELPSQVIKVPLPITCIMKDNPLEIKELYV
jgi:hypothetical protein